jgi:hypothetical protein
MKVTYFSNITIMGISGDLGLNLYNPTPGKNRD